MSVGGYAFEEEQQLFFNGIIYNHAFDKIEAFDENNISEEIDRAWYIANGEQQEPFYTDLKMKMERLR